MEKMMNLHDSWNVMGNDLDEFRAAMKEMTDGTEYKRVNSAELSILTVGSRDADGHVRHVKEIDALSVQDFSEIFAFDDESKEHTLNSLCVDRELAEESFDKAGFMVKYRNKVFPVSETALQHFFHRARLGGDGIYRKSPLRNAYLAECLYKAGIGDLGNGILDTKRTSENATLVLRKDVIGGKKVSKIFALPSEKYTPIPMTVLCDVAEAICDEDMLGRPDVKFWSADHEFSTISIVFPEAAEDIQAAYGLKDNYLPGIILSSSDVGKSCVSVKSVAFVGSLNHYIVLETNKARHAGAVTTEDVLEDAENVLKNVRRLPEKLAELMSKPLCESGSSITGLTRAFEKAYKRIFKACNLSNILGKSREVKIREALMEEINPEASYSLYDAVYNAMTLPDRIQTMSGKLPRNVREQLQESLANAPFAFDPKKKEKEQEEEVFLAP